MFFKYFCRYINARELKYIFSVLCILILSDLSHSVYAQVDRGGMPRSFKSTLTQKSQFQSFDVSAPDILSIQKEDEQNNQLEKAYRVGVEIPVSVSSDVLGQWDILPEGGRIWRMSISSKGAQGIGLKFNKLQLPSGSDLYVYSPDHTFILGAYTSAELINEGLFSTRPVFGNQIIIEYYEPENVFGNSLVEISGIAYMYRGFEVPDTKYNISNTANSCEINVNCPEGQNWKKQKQGVVKIYSKVGNNYYYCSGALVNNTRSDFTNLLFTAAHCAQNKTTGAYASAADFSQWIFYFNYESPGCISAGSMENTVVGAQKLAISDNPFESGSDFLLLKLLTSIPPQYFPYYCGWDIRDQSSSSGVTIHHPNGDIKKISTYNSLLKSDAWGSTPNTHWAVQWIPTVSGHGVTEGGSSGSPLFNSEGHIVGALTGGESSCSEPFLEDKYGKLSYSWISNGTTPDKQLKPWLDPDNTGIKVLQGTFNEKLAVADFMANSRIAPIGGAVNFYDLSSGKPDKWHWYFSGGNPAESRDKNPPNIRYNRYGSYKVKLVVSNTFNTDSIVKVDYIQIRAIVSPNPTTGAINILTDPSNDKDLVVEVFDLYGKKMQSVTFDKVETGNYRLQLPLQGTIFFVRIIQGDHTQVHKVIVVK